jgi:hypothetical protein
MGVIEEILGVILAILVLVDISYRSCMRMPIRP